MAKGSQYAPREQAAQPARLKAGHFVTVRFMDREELMAEGQWAFSKSLSLSGFSKA